MLFTPWHMEQATQQCLASYLVYNVADLLLKGGASAADGLAHVVDKSTKSCSPTIVWRLKKTKWQEHQSGLRVISALASHLNSLKGCKSIQRF